ncbi:MAG: hypothetical protein CMG64_03055 [Candidatus Marinimicrobia bacterium]|nr:hypothetical protein [Candidatus Neomarinimicrobiota bacterium]|tara:strand:+ start:8485 stop:9423 length:939 start_codon:yes stop_codon:yes gene_type:complete
MVMSIFKFCFGLCLLSYSADLLINNSKKIAKIFNISNVVIGVTIVAFGTSLPELVVSIIAALDNEQSLIVGNIIGSNIANIGLVLGVSAFLSPFKIESTQELNFNFFYVLISSLLFSFLLIYYQMHYLSGILFLIILAIYFYLLFKYDFDYEEEENSLITYDVNKFTLFFLIVVGCFGISYGSNLFIEGSIDIADFLGYDNIFIGMTFVAIGTSLPELVTSLVAIVKNERNIAIGNIIGSNIINILLVGGTSSLICSLDIHNIQLLYPHLFIMVFLVFLLIVISIFKIKISRLISSFLIVIYLIFLYINFLK